MTIHGGSTSLYKSQKEICEALELLNQAQLQRIKAAGYVF
jgi:hypothetical protein